MTIFDSKIGKTTYTDADSLSDDLGTKVLGGDKAALEKLKSFATTEDPKRPYSQARALYELSEVYSNGLCEVERSAEKALEHLTQAALLNDALALIRLGEYYRDGKRGFKQDGQQALEYFLKATEVGERNGYKLAAEMFRNGAGGFKADGFRAIEFYEKLDELDDKRAAFNIAQIYEKGCGKLRADGYKAIEIYDDMIRQGKYWMKVRREFGITSFRLRGYKEALGNAARIYLEGKGGVVQDGNKAVELYEKLAEIESLEKSKPESTRHKALFKLAEIYTEGCGSLKPDVKKAVECLNKAYDEYEPLEAAYALAESPTVIKPFITSRRVPIFKQSRRSIVTAKAASRPILKKLSNIFLSMKPPFPFRNVSAQRTI